MTWMLGHSRHLGVTVERMRTNAVNVGPIAKIRQFECPRVVPGRSKSKMCARHTDRFEGGIIYSLEREGSVSRFAFRPVAKGMRT
jgi:hypothetical protein